MNNKSCRICRREGKKLFLKGERCNLPKCSVVKRAYPPGAKGLTRGRKPSDYSIQLREKQRAKAIYGLREKQFKNYYIDASTSKSATGEKLMQNLECRLDNVILKLGLTKTQRQARQIVGHGHILVNNKKINIPSYSVKAKDTISIKKINIKPNNIDFPIWLKFNKQKMTGEVLRKPARNEIGTDINEQLIVEYYSR